MSFVQTRNEIILRALRITGTVGKNATPSAATYNAASICLNALNEELRNEGVFLWQRAQFDITTVAGTAVYTIDDIYETVEKASLVEDEETPIELITESEYFEKRKKDEEGKPEQFVMGHELSNQTLTLYPTPEDVYTIRCVGVKLLQELTSNSDVPEYPARWLNTLTFGTAYLYANEAQLPIERVNSLYSQYQVFLAKAKRKPQEAASIHIEGAYDV